MQNFQKLNIDMFIPESDHIDILSKKSKFNDSTDQSYPPFLTIDLLISICIDFAGYTIMYQNTLVSFYSKNICCTAEIYSRRQQKKKILEGSISSKFVLHPPEDFVLAHKINTVVVHAHIVCNISDTARLQHKRESLLSLHSFL